MELFLNYNISRDLNFSTGLKNTYLEEESYLSAEADFNYKDTDNEWQFEGAFEYIGPYGIRETPQEKFSIEVSRYLYSGLEGFFKIERDYDSSISEEPIYKTSIYFSQALGFAKRDSKFQKYQGLNHKSYITGFVYLDENRNKTRDPDEPLLENINMFLDNSKTISDKDGYFLFENVRTGIHEIGFDLKTLPSDYKVLTNLKVVEVRENENLFLEFGLTKLSEINGQVFLEKSKSSEELIEDISLSHVGIKIEELNRIAFTKNDGSFNFKDIPLGRYTIKVMESSLPKEVMINGENIYKINISREQKMTPDIKIILLSNI